MTVVYRDNSGSRTGDFPEGCCLLGALSQLGADLPAYCGGHGRCRGCEVLLTAGRFLLPQGEVVLQPGDPGITARSCLVKAFGSAVEVALCRQTETGFSADFALDCALPPEKINFTGSAVALDLGSTTLAAAWLKDGKVMRSAGAVNPQRKYGNNVIDRIKCAGTDYAGVRACLLDGIKKVLAALAIPEADLPERLVIAGNPVMSRFAAGLPVEALGKYPFEAKEPLPAEIPAAKLDLKYPCQAEFFPDFGGFVGGDVVAGLYNSGMLAEENRTESVLLADLGTNCEMVLRHKGIFYGISAAAGPGFESVEADSVLAANVYFRNHRFAVEPPADPPCSALSAAALTDVLWILRKLGALDEAGHLDSGALQRLHLAAMADNELACRITPSITLTQRRIIEFLTAKAALRACWKLLLENCGIGENDLKKVVLTGGMARFLKLDSACGTGLLSPALTAWQACGNSALSGTVRLILEQSGVPEIPRCRRQILQPGDYEKFSSYYTENLFFPPLSGKFNER